jgi:RNA polymerase sigma-70 factor (ECF subfamily)
VASEGVDGSDLEVSDASLIEAHLAGDLDAFGQLFRRHRDRLWAVALRTTGNPEDAADALQDALVSAFRRADSYRGEAAVTTWLHRIVVNACLDRLRRRKVRAADPLPDDLDEAAARGAVLADPDQGPDPGPEAHVVAAERREQVLDALEQLRPDQKAALVLVDMEGYPVAEAAAILEVPTGTVKSRCARGRARLAVLLADLGPPGTQASPGASHSGGPPGDPPPEKPTRTSRRPERAVEGGEQA